MLLSLKTGSWQEEKVLLLCSFTPVRIVVGEQRFPQYRMTTLARPAIRIRRAGQHHLDHEPKSFELRACSQARRDQIRLSDVSPVPVYVSPSFERRTTYLYPAQVL